MDKETPTESNNNTFEEEIIELKEWQDSQYNPGYYVGTGKIPFPIKKLGKNPIAVFIVRAILILTIASILISSFAK